MWDLGACCHKQGMDLIIMDFPKSCISLDSTKRQNYTCCCGRADFALLFPPHIPSKPSLFQPSAHDESRALLLSSTVPEL